MSLNVVLVGHFAQEEERMNSELAMIPPEMRDAIDAATRLGRVCMFNPSTGQLIFDDRAPLDSLSSIEAWVIDHPGCAIVQSPIDFIRYDHVGLFIKS